MAKVGLVLGGGAVRGLAHLGVLKAFEKHGIAVDCIAGTSMGGAVGGLFAAGIPADALEHFIQTTPKYRLIDVGIRQRGLISGNGLLKAVNEWLKQHGKNTLLIEHLPIRFKTVSVDLMQGKQVVFDQGDLLTALRATTAFPGIFSPLMHDGMMLVDGGVLNNLPVEELGQEKGQLVIAVDVTREHEKNPPRNMVEVVYRSYSLMTAERKHSSLRLADMVIRPEVGHIAAFDFTRWQECIEAGEKATERIMEELKRQIAHHAQ
ncbi:patatin-like phospholipase family protein [Paenibacillus validus]|uniref:Patatin n=1 Tax=Paenibacillus validus TaxID=44253 RepID=A0A7X3CR68_9BACL|nr:MULTISPECIES: patatin-like phospholipase family protein [Paenibacillus]MED4600619.1 patatin-like phospholipase family protein [Paenibacillus validus]MED4606252.1 patatin-like phospholipase family protein [Paenibacillus validus]MUG69922.1 patatin [Paenibacillus validus]